MAFLTGGLLDFLSKIAEKVEGGTYDRTTDSNEALAEAIAGLSSVSKAELEVTRAQMDGIGYVTLIDITGSGMLYFVGAKGSSATRDHLLKLTIDGDTQELGLGSNNTERWVTFEDTTTDANHWQLTETFSILCILNVQFQDELKVEYRSGGGTGDELMDAKCMYGVD